MAALTDQSIGIVNETTPGTYAAPTRFYEWSEGSYEWTPNTVQGAGLRVGSQLPRSGRRVRPTAAGQVEFTVEAISKGMGLLWESCLGTSASTVVSGATYQQNITLATGTTLPSRTVQVASIMADGTVSPLSFLGCTVSAWEFALANEIATLGVTFDASKIDTAQSYASPSYPTTPNLFHHANATATIGGTVVEPTTTVLATGGTAVTNVRSFSLSGDNGLVDDRFNFGGGGRKARQLRGQAAITGQIEVEFTDAVVRDAFLADTATPLTLKIEAGALSSGNETLQIVLPCVKFDGALPPRTDGGLSVISAGFTVLDDLTASQPIWIVHRTADTAV